MGNIRNLNLLAVAALFFASCAKVGPTGPTGPAGPSYTGNISGHVSLYDKYGSKVLTRLDSVTLSLSSSTTTLSGNAPVNADNSGYFLFKDVKTGSYAIAASATGYAATVAGNISFVVGTLNRDIALSAIPDAFITSFTANAGIAGNYDSLVLNVSSEIQKRNCIVFVSNTSAVSNASAGHLLTYIISIEPGTTRSTVLIPASDLRNAGIAGGSMVYYAAYSYVVNDRSVYEDFATGKYIYNAVNANPIIDSAIAP